MPLCHYSYTRNSTYKECPHRALEAYFLYEKQNGVCFTCVFLSNDFFAAWLISRDPGHDSLTTPSHAIRHDPFIHLQGVHFHAGGGGEPERFAGESRFREQQHSS